MKAKDKQMITVCRKCRHPLLWTFLFDGAEYYCLNCGGKTGMMGGGDDVEATVKLKAQQRVYKGIFGSIRGYALGSGRFQRITCKRCKDRNEYHGLHTTEFEREKDKVASLFLDRLKGKK